MNLLNQSSYSKFVSGSWDIVNDQWNANYSVGNEIIYITELLKSNLGDYNVAYILISGDVTVTGCNAETQAAFENCATFDTFITKIDETTIDYAEDLDLVTPMLECWKIV